MSKKKLAEEVKEPTEAKVEEVKVEKKEERAVEAQPEKKLSKVELFLAAYKKQNPKKYAQKLARGQFKNLALMVALIAVGFVGVFSVASAYQGYDAAPKVVVEGDYIESGTESSVVYEESLGAVSGPDVYSYLKVHGRFMQGAYPVATSTDGTATVLLTTDLWKYSGMDMTPVNTAITLTLPATTTLGLAIKSPGDCMEWRMRNVTSTAAATVTLAAGTGIDLVENENGDVVIEGGNEAQLRFCRELDTDVTVYVDEYIAAD
uniref:Uncharacterized protein n=1 Tax=uncultured marine virus TaxID=186617 RepID=A0A0F7L7I5_9VIRU|nr:hypothetical protein [uncultured marine virus]